MIYIAAFVYFFFFFFRDSLKHLRQFVVLRLHYTCAFQKWLNPMADKLEK